MTLSKEAKSFLHERGIPCTKRERDAMTEKELSKLFFDLTEMRKEEYERILKEYDFYGTWDDRFHEVLMEACNWVRCGILQFRKRPWLCSGRKILFIEERKEKVG